MRYIVEKEKGGRYYVHPEESPTPIKGSFGDKRHALKFAAQAKGISTREYMKLRKSEGCKDD